MQKLSVSLIVTAKNEASDIEACLKSLLNQSIDCEVILVDNRSSDGTAEIAQKLGVRVEQQGPERSAQRNRGLKISQGEFIGFLDADMIAPPNMASECVAIMETEEVGAVVVPEESFGEGFWAKCKVLERSCYPPGSYVEAARFYKRAVIESLGGFDEELTGLEDLDLHQRCAKQYPIGHSASPILHHEGNIRFFEQIRKKFYYGKNSWKYARKHPEMFRKQGNPFRGYFLGNWRSLLRTPVLAISMIFLKTLEVAAGGLGILTGIIKEKLQYPRKR